MWGWIIITFKENIIMDFWKEFLISNAIGIILSSVKNPDSKAKFRRAFLKIRNTINEAFATDPDFQ